MPNKNSWSIKRIERAAAACAAVAILAWTPAAMAACRVSDFTSKTLGSLGEVQRLSFVSQMTQTEFDKLHALPPGSPNYDELIVRSAGVAEARQAAQTRLANLAVENIDDYRKIWASDFLTDEELQRFTTCTSGRQPGLTVAGRSDGPGKFNLTFAHVTPIGIEKITTRLVASYNIANVRELEDFLTGIGPRDNYTAQTFPLHLIDPNRRAVVVLRAGWETPKFVYIPIYPTPQYFR
jgi:hypothetical protein